MKILFIANPESIFVRKLLENLERYSIDYGIYCCGRIFKKAHQYKVFCGRLQPNGKILKFLYYKKCVKNIKEIDEYDLIHVNFLDLKANFFEKIYNKKKLIVTFWGSDLYRLSRSRIYKFFQKRVLKKADIVTVVHEKMVREFYRTYKINKPIYVTPFPVPLNFRKIDEISREEVERYKENLGAKNLIIVTLGYSGDPKKNHEYMIEEVAKIREDLKERVFVVIPMTYGGNKEYIESIKEYCKEKFGGKIRYKIFTDRLNEDEVLLLRKAEDILINVQTTDAFSASMQESLYAESIVINGGWLDYSEIQEKGGYFETIESLESGKLKEKLEYVIDHFNELKKKTAVNKTIITNRNDWKKATERFLEIYEKALNMTKNIEKT